jgi:tRNA A-37 threonylcarbamoyl transferase component Bud32
VDDPALPQPPRVPGLTGLVVLARGGYSTVYRAVQVSVGRDVAVKIENRALDSDLDRGRFLREARAAGRMSSHSFVVDLFDAGVTDGGHPYLVMELCAGSYADLLKERTLSAQEVRDVGVKIADALADAHKVGVLHRDVKPANILVTEFGEPTLADFGLAVLAEMRDVSMTLDVLTPAYAPREMFRQRCEPSPAADVYSLCATLYTLLWGRPPRWSDERNPSLLTMLELFDRPIPDLPGVPVELMDVLRAGMANDPQARPTAADLGDRLAALSLGRPGTVNSAPPESRPPPQAQRPAADQRPVADQRPRVRPPTVAPGSAPDPESTVPMARRGQPYGGIAALVLTLGMLAGLGAWYGAHDHGSTALAVVGAGSRVASRPVAGTGVGGATGRGASGEGGGTALAGCGFGLTGAICPTVAECFDPLVVSDGFARAPGVPCDGPHTWQTFAVGTLPAGAAVRYPDIKSDPIVGKLCNTATLALVDLDAVLWQVDVLPPDPTAYAAGDRSFRCLAGTGPGGQSSAAFVR